MSSLTAPASSRKSAPMLCFTTAHSRPGASTKLGACAMFWHKFILSAAILAAASSSVQAAEFGRPASPEEIALWDIDVRPDGRGLPAGSGTVAQGKVIFEQNCAACHGEGGQGGNK